MKPPKINNLRIDRAGSKSLRARLKKTKAIKITIHLDARSLSSLEKIGDKRLLPYYESLGQFLKVKPDNTAVSRLERIEKEIKKLKRQIAA